MLQGVAVKDVGHLPFILSVSICNIEQMVGRLLREQYCGPDIPAKHISPLLRM